MKIGTGVLLVAALLFALARSFDCNQIRSRDHLDYMIKDDSSKARISHALSDLFVNEEMSVEEIGERIVTASDQLHPYRHIYLALAELTKAERAECSPETVSLCLAIMGLEELKTFWKFIEASRDRFHQCALENETKILNHVEKIKRMRQIVGSLERFVRLAMGVPNELPDSDYLAELKKFDMFTSKLRTWQLLAAVDKSKYHFKSRRLEVTPVARIERFLDDRCMPFRLVLRDWFNSINLDLLLGNKQSHPEIDRISELHRICLDMASKRSRIIKNLWRGLMSF